VRVAWLTMNSVTTLMTSHTTKGQGRDLGGPTALLVFGFGGSGTISLLCVGFCWAISVCHFVVCLDAVCSTARQGVDQNRPEETALDTEESCSIDG
jgi:hypothetical protein